MSEPRHAGSEPDPTIIFELYRGIYATTLLTAAVAHLDLFATLDRRARTLQQLGEDLQLPARSAVVLVVALRAMGLLKADSAGALTLTDLAKAHLVPGAALDVSGYVGLSADSPAVLEMVKHLRTGKPAGADGDNDDGVAFIFREGMDSAMEQEAAARRLSLALAGRAKIVAPALARAVTLERSRVLLDVAGGTGIYSIACLKRFPNLRAIVWDRPEVLKVAAEFAAEAGVLDRIELRAGDMFADPIPSGCDAMLLSNVLHDWDVPECRQLVEKCAAALPKGGTLLIHDVFLNDEMDGPLPVALYSAALFSVTEGRAYSGGEYCAWLTAAGLAPGPISPTLIHCGVLPATKL